MFWHAKRLVEIFKKQKGTFSPVPSYTSMRTSDWPGLTQAQWDSIKNILSGYIRPRRRKVRRHGGRPPADDKKAFEAILWTLRGGTLERLPPRFGSRRTACRRLKRWGPCGALEQLWAHFFRGLDPRSRSDWAALFQRRQRRRAFWQDMLVTRFQMEFT